MSVVTVPTVSVVTVPTVSVVSAASHWRRGQRFEIPDWVVEARRPPCPVPVGRPVWLY